MAAGVVSLITASAIDDNAKVNQQKHSILF
jgi:hypothetical protein